MPSSGSLSLLVVIVSFNSADDLAGLAASIRATAKGIPHRVVVVDNASSDDSVDAALDAGMACVSAGANLGYAAAINIGRRMLGGSAALLIANPDVRFLDGSIEALMERALAGRCVTVPRIVDAQGATRPSLRREPTLRRQAGEALLGNRLAGRGENWSIVVREPKAYEKPSRADWATGAALLIPAECDDLVGGWAEEYFLYSEEVDFCRRARAAGYPVELVPEAVIYHEEGGSGRSRALVSLDAINRVRYHMRWHGRMAGTAFGLLVLLEKMLRASDGAERAAALAVASTLFGKHGQIPDGREVLLHLTGSREETKRD